MRISGAAAHKVKAAGAIILHIYIQIGMGYYDPIPININNQ